MMRQLPLGAMLLLGVVGAGVFLATVLLPLDLSMWLSPAVKSVRSVPAAPPSRVEPITILFAGDMNFDRYIRSVVARRGWEALFSPALRAKLLAADLVVANLEGPITGHESVSETSMVGEAKNYIFTFPPESAEFLKRSHIEIVNLGNNHILNFGSDGAQSTERLLGQSGVDFFGSPIGEERTLIKTIRGVKFGFVNYNQFITNGKEKAVADITLVKPQVDIVILYAHWGREYAAILPSVKALAHEFIDAGADAIIGSHPHIVQAKEGYQGKTIYYSLGNFIFDQYFQPETKQGLVVEAAIDPVTRAVTFDEIPLELLENGQTTLTTH